MQTKVKDLMTADPVIIPASSTLREAAQKMESIDCGVLPVGSWEKPEGIITDRDIVIRAVAKGKDVNSEQVRDYMTPQIFFCSTEDTLDQAGDKMRENQVARLLVRDSNNKTCGIITFGAILRKDKSRDECAQVVECAVGKKAA